MVSPGETSPSRPVLEYRTVGPRAARRGRFIRIAMLVIAILAAHVAGILIFNPLIEAADFQGYLGGGVLGTPFSPLTLTEPSGELRGGSGHSDEDTVQRQYLPRAIGYFCFFLLTQWWFLSPRGSWRIGAALTAGLRRGGVCDGRRDQAKTA